MERGIVPFAWDTNSTGNNQMTIINRSTKSIYNNYMMEGIKEAIEELKPTSIQYIKKEVLPCNKNTYNLSGQRVTTSSRGLHIQNGKKYFSN